MKQNSNITEMREKKNEQLSGFYYVISEKFPYTYFLNTIAFYVHFFAH